MNQKLFRTNPIIFLINVFILLLLLGASPRPFSPDMAGERLRAELKFLEDENVIEDSPPPTAKAQNIALKEQEIQDESSTPHKKKEQRQQEGLKWLRAR